MLYTRLHPAIFQTTYLPKVPIHYLPSSIANQLPTLKLHPCKYPPIPPSKKNLWVTWYHKRPTDFLYIEGWRSVEVWLGVEYLWLAEKSCSNVSHVCFLELVIHSVVFVDADEVKGCDDSFHIEAHAHESIDQVFVIPLVSGAFVRRLLFDKFRKEITRSVLLS